MYKPEGCKTLADLYEPQIRLGIQGFPGTGKTWGALTFPNPIVLNIDRGLGAHKGRADIIEVPLYDIAYCKIINSNFKDPSNLWDTILLWLDKEAKKLEPDQTLIIDGGTGLQTAFHRWYEKNPVLSKGGVHDDFALWRLKVNFFGSLMESFKSLKCHVIYICHESEKKEKSGDYLGKIRPLMTGQFVDQLASHFTDWVRQHALDKPKDNTDEKLQISFGMSKGDLITMCSNFPRNTIYCWQLDADSIFDGKVSSLINFPKLIPSNYESFKKYMRK